MRVDQDRLCEIGNVGAGHAATALNGLVGGLHWMEPPRGLGLEEAVPGDVIPAGELSAGVFVDLTGDVEGVAGLLAPVAALSDLLDPLIGWAAPEMSDPRARSAFGELGNIILCAAAGAIATLSGGVVRPSPPRICIDDPARMVAMEIEPRLRGWPAYLVDSALSPRRGSIRLRFIWLSCL